MSALERLLKLREQNPGPLRILSASGQLGFGIPKKSFERGIKSKPHVIAADMGSVDPGPTYLATDKIAAPEVLVRSDMRLVLHGAQQLGVPLLIGSAGTAGADVHLDVVLKILKEIAVEDKLHFKLGIIRSVIPHDLVEHSLVNQKLKPIGPIDLDENTLKQTEVIVGQAGMGPFERALKLGVDVIIAGRACDTAPFAVIPKMLGFPTGVAVHMAKILECTSLCCEPGGRDAMLATFDGDSFTVESMNEAMHATPTSVAAHALYEQSDPYFIHEPDGRACLKHAKYEAIDERRVKISGATWQAADKPWIKIEGARKLGSRAVMLAGNADINFIKQSKNIINKVEEVVRELIPFSEWSLNIRHYGIDGVTEWPEPPVNLPREIFLLCECIAENSEKAKLVLATFRQQLLHFGFPGRSATGGNLAFPITPPELDAGEAFTFSIYHLLELDDWSALEQLFPVTIEKIGDQT